MALGLILSSSDINILDGTVVGNTDSPASKFIGGEYGSAGLHSSLSNPLTSSGDFYRTFRVQSGGGQDAFGAYLVSSSVDSSLYSGSISTSKAYSLRAWIRSYGAVGSNVYGGGLTIMTKSNVMTAVSSVYQYALGGYTLQLSGRKVNNTDFSTSHTGLFIGTNTLSGTSDGAFPPVQCDGPNVGIAGGYAEQTWYRVRFDMVPVGSAGVTLNAYTSSAGDVESGQEVWELVGTTFVDATDIVYMDPTLPQNAMGYYAWLDEAGQDDDHFLVDQFEILVEDL